MSITTNINKDTSVLEKLASINPAFMKDIKVDILDTIIEVFDVDYIDIKDIEQMKKGMTNLSFLFTVKKERYVFRVPGRGTDLLINRSEEATAYNKVKDLNISDEIVYIDPHKGFKITKFYEDITTVDPYNDEEVEKAMRVIRDLHEANLKVDHDFDIVERISHYKTICNDLKVEFPNDYYLISKKIDKIIDYISKNRKDKRLCHIDPVSTNFLVFNDKSMRLIDWEYAGMSDPIMDIAMFGIYQQYSDSQIDNLLKVYLEREPNTYEYKVFYGYVALTSYLWYLWTLYKEALGDHYGEYAMMEFDFAHNYSDKFETIQNEDDYE